MLIPPWECVQLNVSLFFYMGCKPQSVFGRIYTFPTDIVLVCNTACNMMHGSHSETAWLCIFWLSDMFCSTTTPALPASWEVAWTSLNCLRKGFNVAHVAPRISNPMGKLSPDKNVSWTPVNRIPVKWRSTVWKIPRVPKDTVFIGQNHDSIIAKITWP